MLLGIGWAMGGSRGREHFERDMKGRCIVGKWSWWTWAWGCRDDKRSPGFYLVSANTSGFRSCEMYRMMGRNSQRRAGRCMRKTLWWNWQAGARMWRSDKSKLNMEGYMDEVYLNLPEQSWALCYIASGKLEEEYCKLFLGVLTGQIGTSLYAQAITLIPVKS